MAASATSSKGKAPAIVDDDDDLDDLDDVIEWVREMRSLL